MRKIVSIVAFCLMLAVLLSAEPTERKVTKYILSEREILGQEVEWELVQNFLPVLRCLFHEQNGDGIYEQYVARWFPICRYLMGQETLVKANANRQELQIGADLAKGLLEENAKRKVPEGFMQEGTGNKSESGADSDKSMSDNEGMNMASNKENGGNFTGENNEGTTVSGNLPQSEENILTVADTVDVSQIFLTPSNFIPASEKKREYDWDSYTDIREIRKEFFAIDATTQISDDRLNPQTLLNKDVSLQEGNGGPQILIYHTHSQESFADSIPGNSGTSIVGAGEYLKGLLQDTYGYEVLHHTGEYDVETRDYAYSYALPNIEAILKEYPSIEVVIDLHRDAVAEDKKLVSIQNGKAAAQVMFFNGLSHTKKQGDIEYLENPYIDDNLSFAFQMQVLCNEYYPGLARRIYLKGYRYNMHLCSKSLLIELGAQTNTCEEAKNTLDIVAHVLDMCLKNENG